tara:strand:- start:942 stop:1643 length:702 start_codon:yes stop_codon:yes gene_type:complete
MGVFTDWGSKISYEFEEWRSLTNHYDMEEFLEKHDYPQEKWMKDRITHAVTRFQAIWRGYLYKKAYPIALSAAKATEAINLNARATMSSKQAEHDNFSTEEEWKQVATAVSPREKWLWSGEGQEDGPVTTSNIASHWWRGLNIGDHCEVLFNRGESTETIYSGKIIKIQGPPSPHIWVKYHYDDEVRRYHWKKFKLLKDECNGFKMKMGIEAKIIGKLATRFLYPWAWPKDDY